MTEAATIGERYSVAISAKRLDPDLVGHTATLASVALCREGLASMLIRLHAEFDIAKATGRPLPSLHAAHLALMSFAIKRARRHATRNRYTDEGQIHDIALNVLSAWLDPKCPHCTGRGHFGGNGKALEICKACAGTGRRKLSALHQSADGDRFAKGLLAEIERKVSVALARAQQIRS